MRSIRDDGPGDFLLGIDVGSTVVKAAVFDRRGRVVAQAERAVPVARPRPGWVERDAEATWVAAAGVVRRVVRGRAKSVTAIGITGCGNGAVLLDRRRRPLRAGILSSDSRAARQLAAPDPGRGQVPYAGQLPWLVAWLRQAEPAVARRLAHAVFWKDFVRARLTDVVCTDFTDAGAAGLLAYPTRRWRRADPVLPPLRSSLDPAGTVTPAAAAVTGLRAGTPVFTGCIDCEATALGSGVHAPGEISMVAGTWSINQSYVVRPPRRPGHFLVNESVTPGRWLVLEGSPSSLANFDWARRTLGGLGAAAATAVAARAPRSDLLFIPQVPTGRGAFVGLSPAHDRGALLRAVMEGIVFAHRAHVDRLLASVGRLQRVTLAGGAARSRFWCQLFADGLGCPVDVPRGPQLGALGAAICAGVGAGLWPSVPAAQNALVPQKRIFTPDAARHAALSRDYERYQQQIQTLLS
mgnify:CR=1 FL=1